MTPGENLTSSELPHSGVGVKKMEEVAKGVA